MRIFVRILPFIIYFLPGIIAALRGRKEWREIFFGNLFLGWTIVGYIYFLSLACESDEVRRARLEREAQRSNQSLIGTVSIVVGALALVASLLSGLSPELLIFSGICLLGGVAAKESRKRAHLSYAENVVQGSPRSGKHAVQLTELEEAFGKHRDSENAEFASWATEAYRQLAAIELRFQEFSLSLGRKLSPRELTHVRYARAAENLFEAVLSNLRVTASLLASMKAIGIEGLREKISGLESDSDGSTRAEAKINTLRERVAVWRSQGEKIDDLVAKNESALTAFDKLNASLAETNLHEGRAQGSFEHALEEIESLSDRFSDYDQKPVRWSIRAKKKDKKRVPLGVRLGLSRGSEEPEKH